jgi:hypothetical protein
MIITLAESDRKVDRLVAGEKRGYLERMVLFFGSSKWASSPSRPTAAPP